MWIFRVFWLNIAKKWVYCDMGTVESYLEKMKKEANFGNIVAEIVTKKYERGERNDVMTGVRKIWISVMWLPKCCCPDEVPKGEKCSKGKINKNQLWQPSCQNWREKKGIMGGKRKNCGN